VLTASTPYISAHSNRWKTRHRDWLTQSVRMKLHRLGSKTTSWMGSKCGSVMGSKRGHCDGFEVGNGLVGSKWSRG
jgi:hypothetical protein